jgi:predicted nucleic acid-binding protein
VRRQEQHGFFVSAVSLIEISFGIRRMPVGRRRIGFENWFKTVLVPSIRPGLVEVDEEIALRCAELLAMQPNTEISDALIAASALVHRLIVATRNVKHFAFEGLDIFNPWEE